MIHVIPVIPVIQVTGHGSQFSPAVPELVVQVVLVEVELQLHEPTWEVPHYQRPKQSCWHRPSYDSPMYLGIATALSKDCEFNHTEPFTQVA